MKAREFSFKTIKIWRVGEESGEPYSIIYKAGVSENTVTSFQYYEDLFDIGYKATLVINERGQNLPGTMPIQGFEKVTVELTDYKGDDREYEFRVWKVGNRVEKERSRSYTLGLVSAALLANEGIFVNRVLEGTPTTIVGKLLREYFKVSDVQMKLQESVNSMKIIPASKSPFSIIRDLQAKTISAGAEPKTKTKAEVSSGASTVSSDSPGNVSQAKGTAGFIFYQDFDGFHFKSIDSLVSTSTDKFNGSGPVASYTYQAANVDATDAQNDRKIMEVEFKNEIDLLKKLRQGAYSSLCCFFNINTGKYEEYVYKLSDMWDNMAHLGAQKKLPQGQVTLSQYPTRILSTVVNHENWYNGTDIASNEDSENPGDFTDYQKQYLLQSIARAGILFNQQLTISVTGNLDLRVGNKIEVKIPNQIPHAEKENAGSFDPEHSGIYLIRKITNIFDNRTKECDTVLELIRDSIGYEESNVK